MIQYYDNVKTRFRETWSNGVLCNGAPVPVGAAHRFGFYPDSPQNKSHFSGKTVSQTSDDSFGNTLATIALVDSISDFSSPSVDTSSSSDFSGGGGDFGGGGSSGSW